MRSTFIFFFFSSRRRHTRFDCDWSSDVCSSDLAVSTAQMPDTTARVRHGAARQALNDSIAAVQAAAVAFRGDLRTASSDLVLARARRLPGRCAAARRAAPPPALLLAHGPLPPGERRAPRHL